MRKSDPGKPTVRIDQEEAGSCAPGLPRWRHGGGNGGELTEWTLSLVARAVEERDPALGVVASAAPRRTYSRLLLHPGITGYKRL